MFDAIPGAEGARGTHVILAPQLPDPENLHTGVGHIVGRQAWQLAREAFAKVDAEVIRGLAECATSWAEPPSFSIPAKARAAPRPAAGLASLAASITPRTWSLLRQRWPGVPNP